MTDQEVKDRLEIQHLLASYNTAGDRGILEGLAAVFGKDGVLVLEDGPKKGPAEIVEALSKGLGRNPKLTVVRHHLTTSLINIDGDTGTGRTYFNVLTDIGPDHHGVYVDKYRRIDGKWWIAHRDVRIDWQSPESLFAPQTVRGKKPTAQ